VKKHLLPILLFVCFCAVAARAEEPTPEFQVDQKASFPDDRSVTDEIDDYLNGKNYARGVNTREKGGDFYIAVGTGTIQAPRDNKAYLTSRANAFEKAMLQAKKEMVEYLGVEISKDVVNDYVEGENPAVRAQRESEAMKSPDILEKTSALVNAKLDKMLAEEGVNLSKPVPKEEVRKIATSEDFKQLIRKVASARVVGMQAMKVFEASPDGKKGQIGVIAVYSEKLHKMADAMFSGKGANVPAGTPQKRIIDQIPTDKLVLLSTFGVQQKTDENGRLVLVAYGQGVPATDNPRALDAAFEKANMAALGALRSFAGEIATVESEVQNFESTKEFEDGMEQYKNESYFKDKVESHANALKVSGITKVKSWDTVHPLVNQRVAGVIIAWSPASAAHANILGNKMATEPQKASAPGAKPSSNVYKAGSGQGGSYHGAGSDADKDSF
jgi:hypothetical protein